MGKAAEVAKVERLMKAMKKVVSKGDDWWDDIKSKGRAFAFTRSRGFGFLGFWWPAHERAQIDRIVVKANNNRAGLSCDIIVNQSGGKRKSEKEY